MKTIERLVVVTLIVAACFVPVFGGVPQPCEVVYGLVRDAFGFPYVDNAEITLARGQAECARFKIRGILGGGVNYRTELNLDSGGSLYALYAVHKGDQVAVSVQVGGAVQPLMPTNRITVGAPGTLKRLDLCTGTDADGDGLPDEWEQLLIAQSGGRLQTTADVKPGDDFDGDGLSNEREFYAGTFAFLKTDLLEVDSVKIASAGRFKIRFLSSPNMTYRLIAAENLAGQDWFPVAFSADENGALAYNEIVGDGSYKTVYVEINAPVMFLRLATQQ